ncbi:MAG: methionyl-tRNA formyltransferase [Clostridiales bacterium]|nr:methionyl-tRNA formyltransferase [Clostridiales bacterium]
MRVVFMGTPQFAVPSLKALKNMDGVEVVGVFTQPDRPKGRGNKVVPSPVKVIAVEAGIPVFQPERIRKTGVEDLKALKPDLCVTAAFGQILSREILDIPPMGNINVHASLLPRHRGSAPIAYAIMAGDEKAGVTTMMMDEGIDTGDMLLTAETEIGESETCGELTERLSEIGAELLVKTIEEIRAGTLKRIPQDERKMTYDPMLKKEMGIVDFSMDAGKARGAINGLNPWPCVSVPFEGERLKLLRAVTAEGSGKPGEVITADPKAGLIIACGRDAVKILEVQAPGGKRMRAEDFLRGHAIAVGTDLNEGNREG